MIVLVIGMHRSGTSALAGLLHHNGIVMGIGKEFYPPPMKENPKGFFENVRFRRVNDYILRKNDYRVKEFSPFVPTIYSVTGGLYDQMKSMVVEYGSTYPYWGWKDPRTCLTLNSWLEVFRDLQLLPTVKILHIYRAYLEVASSMKARGNRERFRNQFYNLAGVYNGRVNQTLANFDSKVQCFNLHFRDLLNEPNETADSINGFLGKELIKDVSFINPAISQNSGELERGRSEQ